MATHPVEHIVCLTDLTPASEYLFHHALAMALAAHAKLTLLYIGPEHRDEVPWERFPKVRETLMRWGKLPPDCDKAAVMEKLGVQVSKRSFRDHSQLQGLLSYVKQHHPDLVVAAHKGHGRLSRWFGDAGVAGIVKYCLTNVLFLPEKGNGFVDGSSGEGSLNRILLPVAAHPDPGPAVAICHHLIPRLAPQHAEVTLFHLGNERTAPDLELQQQEELRWSWHFAKGRLIPQILAAARNTDAQLIAMASAGRPGFWQGLHRSATEKVLRRTPSSMLVVASI